jgi:hypothetical protein
MATADNLFDTLRDLLAASNPGLVTRDDLREVEDRLAELEELVDELAERLAASKS